MSSKAKTKEKKITKQGLQPKLRFPEFRDAAGWKAQPLEKYLDYQQPTPYLVADTKYSNDYKTPVLTAGKTFLLGYTNEQDGIFRDGLPVIIFDDFTTATQFVDFPFKAKSSAMKILQAKNGASIKFMYEIMQMISYEVGTHERHWISKFAPMLVPFPEDPKEQQKIADCLSSIDELIEAEGHKYEALKEYKNGLMQHLFPAEGETIPKLRFPEFRDVGDWEKKKIGDKDFASIYKGKGISKADIALNGKTPCIRYGELYTHYGEIIDIVFSKTNCSTSELFLSQNNDVIIPASGETKIDIAKASCVRLDNVALGGDLNVIRPRHNGVFISYYLNGALRSEIAKVAQGNSVVHLYPSQLEQIEILIPKKQEQQKIADCLSSLDKLIEAEEQKLDALKENKKGLMQKLFPAVSEVRE
ncbi:MAG: restriction endonuclease subunit S [Oligoflexales bacterium]